jgi:hypothetical protein
MVDPLRDDPFLGNGTKRELLVRFWYPASITEGCDPAAYTSPAVWSYFSELAGFPLPDVRTNSCLDAPISMGPHPVVVFTHGYTGTFTDYTFLFEDLASRGYVVAAVDHTYEATAVEFLDGRLVKSVFGSHLAENTLRRDGQSFSLAVSMRSKDLQFVVDELERLNGEASGRSARLPHPSWQTCWSGHDRVAYSPPHLSLMDGSQRHAAWNPERLDAPHGHQDDHEWVWKCHAGGDA